MSYRSTDRPAKSYRLGIDRGGGPDADSDHWTGGAGTGSETDVRARLGFPVPSSRDSDNSSSSSLPILRERTISYSPVNMRSKMVLVNSEVHNMERKVAGVESRSLDSDEEDSAGGGGNVQRGGRMPITFNSIQNKPQRDFNSEPRKTLFIGRLAPTTTEEQLRKYFERFGDIRSLYLIRDIITGDSRRYAFCEYSRTKEADRAYAEAHNAIIDGRRILVDREFGRTMKGWKPRRMGGGFGGFKESGQIRFGGRTSYGGGAGEPDKSFQGSGTGYRPRAQYQLTNGHHRGGYNGNNNNNYNHSSHSYGSHHHGGTHPYQSHNSSHSNAYNRNSGPIRSSGDFDNSLRSRMHGSNSGGIGSGGFRHSSMRSTRR